MNKLENKLMNNYLEQLSFRAENTVRELQLLQKHICVIKSQMKIENSLNKTKVNTSNISIDGQAQMDKSPTDLIKLKEVMQMTGVSRAFIYAQKKEGNFPQSISLGSRSVAWVRSSVEEWVLDKINHN